MPVILNDPTVTNAVSSSFTTNTTGEANSEEMDTFLNLLLTQLQNQDPLDPVDTEEYTSQLVEFSSLEQIMLLNENTVAANEKLQVANSTNALSYIGKEVELQTDQSVVQNGEVTWHVMAEQSGDMDVRITDSAGVVVYSENLPLTLGRNNVTLDISELSDSVDEGEVLQISVIAQTGQNEGINTEVSAWVAVESVDTSGAESDQALLEAGDLSFTDSYILKVVNPKQELDESEELAALSGPEEDDTSLIEDVVEGIEEGIEDAIDLVI